MSATRSGRQIRLIQNDLLNSQRSSAQVILFEQLMDAKSLFLTGNTDTVYVAGILNLGRDGPTVIEVPAGAGPGTVNDAYFRFVTDMGGPGPDKGAGGKYLIIPPGYDGKVPEGYFVCHSPTYTNFMVNRGWAKSFGEVLERFLERWEARPRSCHVEGRFEDLSSLPRKGSTKDGVYQHIWKGDVARGTCMMIYIIYDHYVVI